MISLKDIQDTWVAIDTSKFLYAKFDIKLDGDCSLFVGPGKEKAKFIINAINLNEENIEILLMNIEDGILLEFKGKYDSNFDTLVLETKSLDYSFLFIRESKMKEILTHL